MHILLLYVCTLVACYVAVFMSVSCYVFYVSALVSFCKTLPFVASERFACF